MGIETASRWWEDGLEHIRKFRASEADIALACAASVHPEPGEMLLNSSNPAGTQGTAVHEVNEGTVKTGNIPEDWQSICRGHGLSNKEIEDSGYLLFAAKDFWNRYRKYFGDKPNTETEIKEELTIQPSGETVLLSGHLDVSAVIEDGFVLDWKTTRLDINYSGQMQFYAWLLWMRHPYISKVTTMLAFLRDRTANIQEWTADQIREFSARYQRDVIQWDGRTYRPGGPCAYCKRWAHCPAQSTMITTTHRAIVGSQLHLPADPDDLITLHEKVGALKQLIKQYDEAVKARVAHEGMIQGTDKRLALIDSGRDSIDARTAWPALSRELDEETLSDCLTVGKTKVLTAIGAKYERGQKGKMKAAFMDELREMGAVERKEILSLRLLQGQAKEEKISE